MMLRTLQLLSALTLLMVYCVLPKSGAASEPRLLGSLTIPGDAQDLSGLSGEFPGGETRNQLGGFSAITYTGSNDEYLIIPDRGPDSTAEPYYCRLHRLRITPPGDRGELANFQLLETTFLSEQRRRFVGDPAAFQANGRFAQRLDPEGIVFRSASEIVISDEFGPQLLLFSPDGELQRRYPVPEHFQVETAGLTKKSENQLNSRGRQGNRGFEGVTVTADGNNIFTILQGPCLQDHAFDNENKSYGLFCRILQLDLTTGRQREYAYQLESAKHGVSEILMLDEHRLLVLERDGKPGSASKCKAVYCIDLSQATDISQLARLPATKLPADVRAVDKSSFLDFRDAKYGLRNSLPAKLEGLTWGPKLASGERLLLVCSDNDFEPEQASRVYFFAIPN
ncbi:esterase-like activity of phytase family protein [Planctomycetaceae bacterium SH139]